MTCQKCRFEFCWICMGDWHTHGSNTGGYYKCNKYDGKDPDAEKDDMSDAARAKRELDRYLHYYQRFHAVSSDRRFRPHSLTIFKLT